VATWNSAGVSRAVEDSSNTLCPILKKHGIKQSGYFGRVQGDVVQATGEGTILSNTFENGADVHVLQMYHGLKTSRVFKLTAPLAATAAGAGIGSAIFPVVGTAIGAAIGFTAALITLAVRATSFHISRHFDSDLGPHRLYITPLHNDKIQEILLNKSFIIQLGSRFISALNPTGQRSIDLLSIIERGDSAHLKQALTQIFAESSSKYYALCKKTDINGNTILHHIANQGDNGLWNVLLQTLPPDKTVADVFQVNLKNKDGKTAEALARESDNAELADQIAICKPVPKLPMKTRPRR
jgi:hypothetical protein